MAYNKILVADSVVQRLVENQGIYQLCNRSYDSLVIPGASSVDVPKLAVTKVKKTGTSATHADRIKSKDKTSMVNIPLGPYVVPLANEILSKYETNGALGMQYLDSAALQIEEQFDIDVLTEAQSTSDKTVFASAKLTWADIVGIGKNMDVNKVPKSGRVIAVNANLAEDFFDIDVIKAAIGYNQSFLQSGTLLKILGMTFFITGLAPTITVDEAEHYTVTGFYGPGLAFILSRNGEIKEAWDGENLQDNIDLLAHAGVKLFDDKFAVVKYKQEEVA